MDTQAQGEFELMEGATSDVMARFVELVKAQGYFILKMRLSVFSPNWQNR